MADTKDKPTAKPLAEMTVAELEQESYRLDAERLKIREAMLEVQNWLGKRNEEARVSALLGRSVTLAEAATETDETKLEMPAEQQAGSLAGAD